MASSGGGNPQPSSSNNTPTPASVWGIIGGAEVVATAASITAQATMTTHSNNLDPTQRSAPPIP